MKTILICVCLTLNLFVPAVVVAQGQVASPNAGVVRSEDPAHQELRQLRDGVLAAMNKGDLEGILGFLHTNVVITWHNAEVSRGHAGIRAYYNRIMTGRAKLVDDFKCSINVDELTILYGGDTGISFGSSDEHFKLTKGNDLNVKGRWSATLVKENGRWLVASLHASTNLFDNVLLDWTKRTGVIAAVVCLSIGVLAGWFVGGRRKRAG